MKNYFESFKPHTNQLLICYFVAYMQRVIIIIQSDLNPFNRPSYKAPTKQQTPDRQWKKTTENYFAFLSRSRKTLAPYSKFSSHRPFSAQLIVIANGPCHRRKQISLLRKKIIYGVENVAWVFFHTKCAFCIRKCLEIVGVVKLLRIILGKWIYLVQL